MAPTPARTKAPSASWLARAWTSCCSMTRAARPPCASSSSATPWSGARTSAAAEPRPRPGEPRAARRTLKSVTTLRIVHAEPRPGRLANGEFQILGHLVVLADDAGHRAVPIWRGGALGALYLADLLERPADQVITDGVPQELTTRLLGAARARVTGVDIDVTEAGAGELSPEVTVARIGLAGPAGTRQVTADLGLGLALAAAAGAPVRLADAVLDRLALPVPGDDLLTPFLDRVPPGATALPGHGPRGWPMATLPGGRARYEPRNLDFAGGLDRRDLDSGPGSDPGRPRAA